MQNFVVIGRVHFKPEHYKIWSNFEFDRNIVSGMGTWWRSWLHSSSEPSQWEWPISRRINRGWNLLQKSPEFDLYQSNCGDQPYGWWEHYNPWVCSFEIEFNHFCGDYQRLAWCVCVCSLEHLWFSMIWYIYFISWIVLVVVHQEIATTQGKLNQWLESDWLWDHLLFMSVSYDVCLFTSRDILCSLQTSDAWHMRCKLCVIANMDGEGWPHKQHQCKHLQSVPSNELSREDWHHKTREIEGKPIAFSPAMAQMLWTGWLTSTRPSTKMLGHALKIVWMRRLTQTVEKRLRRRRGYISGGGNPRALRAMGHSPNGTIFFGFLSFSFTFIDMYCLWLKVSLKINSA